MHIITDRIINLGPFFGPGTLSALPIVRGDTIVLSSPEMEKFPITGDQMVVNTGPGGSIRVCYTVQGLQDGIVQVFMEHLSGNGVGYSWHSLEAWQTAFAAL